MELQRKITIKGCGWDKKAIMAALLLEAAQPATKDAAAKEAIYKEKIDLIKVVGIVSKATPKTTEMGDYLELSGQFTAVNLDTGEQFMAPKCILNDVISGPIAAAFGDGANEVQFGALIGAKYQETAATGYVYSMTPLLEVKPSNAMTALLEKAGVTGAAALEAPVVNGGNASAPTPAPAAAASSKAKGK